MLQIAHVSKRFETVAALADIDLKVEAGEVVGLIGTSGCGKSTLLRLVGGLDTPTTGTVALDGAPVTGPSPEVGFVFQEPRLMPWLTVRQNAEFGLAHLPREGREALSAEALERVGLAGFADALPHRLSGGMAQRAAIARALVTRPKVLLLDEPFSALDAFTRLQLQDHLLQLWRDARPTMLFVTHDVEEALILADRVVVLRGRPGRLHRDYRIDLPRPRRQADPRLAEWKERLLGDLDLAAA